MAEEAHEYSEPRFYIREFKLEAVRLSESSEQTVAQIARDLGMPEQALYRWRQATARSEGRSGHARSLFRSLCSPPAGSWPIWRAEAMSTAGGGRA